MRHLTELQQLNHVRKWLCTFFGGGGELVIAKYLFIYAKMVIFKKSGQYESVEIMLGSIQREWYSLKLWWPAWKIWMLNYRLCQKSAGRRMSLVDHTQKSLSVGIFLHKKLCCGASHPFGVPISGSPYFGGVGSGSCYCYKSKNV